MPGLIKVTKGEQKGTIIALCEKAGSTSMRQTLRRHRAGVLMDVHVARTHQYPIRVYLRHPIERMISAWRYFYPSQFPHQTGIKTHASFPEFVDAVLRGVTNEHWDPQLALLNGCNIDEIFRFEQVNETWPKEWPLEHLNQSHFSVRNPEIIHRHGDLMKHYEAELEAWHVLREL